MVKHSLKTGLSFGLTSGVITTLGLLTGLQSGTHSKLAVIGGIISIAITDAFSDALGIHVSEESEAKHSPREIWEATASTFITKAFSAASFIFPILLFPLKKAVIVSVSWGLILLGSFSFYLGRKVEVEAWKVVVEHLLIALLVIGITHYLGVWISSTF